MLGERYFPGTVLIMEERHRALGKQWKVYRRLNIAEGNKEGIVQQRLGNNPMFEARDECEGFLNRKIQRALAT